MADLNCIEVPVEFSVAACTRANPIHWALLEVLRTFPIGSRPDFATAAERLNIHEPAFLSQAWAELGAGSAVAGTDFDNAELTDIGTEALRIGYFLTSPVDTRRVSLVFGVHGERCIERREFDLIQGNRLKRPPAWASNLRLEQLLNAMSHQMPLQLPIEGERIIDFKLLWDEAFESVAKW